MLDDSYTTDNEHTWNVAVIMACDATMAAPSATTSDGISQPFGTLL
jgi:hypothetical protein